MRDFLSLESDGVFSSSTEDVYVLLPPLVFLICEDFLFVFYFLHVFQSY